MADFADNIGVVLVWKYLDEILFFYCLYKTVTNNGRSSTCRSVWKGDRESQLLIHAKINFDERIASKNAKYRAIQS